MAQEGACYTINTRGVAFGGPNLKDLQEQIAVWGRTRQGVDCLASWRATMTPQMEATYATTRESASVRLPSYDTRDDCAAQVLVDTGREQKAGGSWCGTAGCPPQRGAERERERSADEREAQGHQRRDDEGRCGAAHPAAVWLRS